MFSFDTTIFVELERYYEKSTNPKMWDVIYQKMDNAEILVSAEVIDELNYIGNGGEWIRNDHSNCVVESHYDIQSHVSDLVNLYYAGKFSNILTSNFADPFVVAVAKENNASVVSLERINTTIRDNPQQIYNPTLLPKIPNICHIENIAHYDLTTFFVEIGQF